MYWVYHSIDSFNYLRGKLPQNYDVRPVASRVDLQGFFDLNCKGGDISAVFIELDHEKVKKGVVPAELKKATELCDYFLARFGYRPAVFLMTEGDVFQCPDSVFIVC